MGRTNGDFNMKAFDPASRRHGHAEDTGQGASLVDDVAFRIQADILHGVFAPGQHITQWELCERFGVSRTPIREALQQLQAQNMVVIVPNKGAVVQTPTATGLMEVYAIRAELEGFSSELAAGLWTEDDDIELLAAQAKLGVLVASALKYSNRTPDSDTKIASQIATVNEEFHSIIHRASGNLRLKQLIVSLQNSIPVRQVWYAVKSANEAEHLNLQDHQEIIEALQKRDGAKAREATRRHILHAGKLLVEAFGRQSSD